ncbi:MAG: hypothetical protein KGJ58_00580 [Patescibacteria group bacterium]|nr:hypothetical protein [Patescibacteria group bacterium]MDE1988797.1 hypothetical protein [Patescibacteria group bacterium]MDE2217938.1 hypothetical protein [Patescibacteria group bacterium]
MKLYKNIKLVKLAAKGFIETVIFMIALGLNNDYSLRHLDEYERQSFLDGEG